MERCRKVFQILFFAFLFIHGTADDVDDDKEVETDKKLEIKDESFPRCGYRTPILQEEAENDIRVKRVVGGHDARNNSWPWMVSILVDGDFHCGASLISQTYVLSAAHCFSADGHVSMSRFKLVIGSHTPEDGPKYLVERIIMYPKYRHNQVHHDIALVKVQGKVLLSKIVYPVCLPPNDITIEQGLKTVKVTGWGMTSHRGEKSGLLKELNSPIIPTKECNDTMGPLLGNYLPGGITDAYICAGPIIKGEAVCNGDSGGPLMIETANKRWIELGVVSFGETKCSGLYPEVYSNTLTYRAWIFENTDLGKN